MKVVSEKQRRLFEALENCGDLIFACGPKGVSVNLVGQFSIERNGRGEDQLNVNDGTDHVHIDWSRVERVTIGEFHGEGMLIFYNGQDPLFRLYRMGGLYPKLVTEMEGDLIDAATD